MRCIHAPECKWKQVKFNLCLLCTVVKIFLILNSYRPEDGEGAQDGDGEGSETGREEEKQEEVGDQSDDNSQSTDGSKDFEFVTKDWTEEIQNRIDTNISIFFCKYF